MPNPRPIETIHDLFATTRRPSDGELSAKADFQDDVYEALAELDYIYVDELIAKNVDNSVIKPHQPISLVDFLKAWRSFATMGVVEVTDIVEAIHREILLRPLGRFNNGNLEHWQRGITGRIYGTVRQAMQLVGNNIAIGLRLYNTV